MAEKNESSGKGKGKKAPAERGKTKRVLVVGAEKFPTKELPEALRKRLRSVGASQSPEVTLWVEAKDCEGGPVEAVVDSARDTEGVQVPGLYKALPAESWGQAVELTPPQQVALDIKVRKT